MKALPLALLVVAAGCGGDPDVDEGLAPPPSSTVSGDAVIAAPLDEAHPVVLFLVMVADARRTPLEVPITTDVTVIPESVLAEGGDGVRTGPYTFGLVAPGAYIVSGIVDVDENFNPFDSEPDAPTAPDLVGGHADIVTGELITILVGPNQVVGEVTVLFAPPPSS